MKVRLVCSRDDFRAGGSLRLAETIARGLSDIADVKVVFVYGGPGPVAAAGKAPVQFLGVRARRDVLGWWRARRWLAKETADVVHFLDPVRGLLPLMRLGGLRTLVHVHGQVVNRRPIASVDARGQRRWRLIASRVAGLVCISDSVRESLLALGVAPGKCHVIHNAIDTRPFKSLPDASSARHRLGLPETAHVLGVVGRLVLGKGTKEALALAARLPDWHLIWAGEGPERARVEEEIRERGLGRRVHLLGAIPDARTAYAAMDAYLFLSHYESFGLSLAEAMAADVPLFGLAGLGEYQDPACPLVRPELCDFVPRAHPQDPYTEETQALDELARRLRRFARNPKPNRMRAKKARAHVEDFFGVNRLVRDLLPLYDSVCRNRDGLARDALT